MMMNAYDMIKWVSLLGAASVNGPCGLHISDHPIIAATASRNAQRFAYLKLKEKSKTDQQEKGTTEEETWLWHPNF
ncbi:unnamed protein product [Sphenostylis stenocarpa]|uniref:Uncharacterized protein n=1 Tax=Sphenostylis stenocarpa TaxID=92480 RepID=A0AA86VV40_9FABA|nr:unnamed protein product [Sphenostylis stenocarpa]